jgi:mitotic spindle assembly checkpoint protein MAD2
LLWIVEWLETGTLRQMVLVITDVNTSEVLERWTFDIETNQEVLAGGYANLSA